MRAIINLGAVWWHSVRSGGMRSGGRRRAHVAVALTLFASTGCSTTATIHRRDSVVEGRIVGGDKSDLVVATRSGERLMLIPRGEITSIDHPGTVAGPIGAALLVFGALNHVVGFRRCDGTNEELCVGSLGGLLIGGIGAGLFAWATTVWLRSTGAAEPVGSRSSVALPSSEARTDVALWRHAAGGVPEGTDWAAVVVRLMPGDVL
jgi:hypothetical protein